MRRTTWVPGLAVAFLWATVCAAGSAQTGPGDVMGTLTLPFAARWGQTLLPAGDYSFALDSVGGSRLIRVRGDGSALVVPAVATRESEAGTVADPSALVAVRHHGSYSIRALRLSAQGRDLVFIFPASDGEAERASRTPALLQRVPIQVLGR